MESPVRYVFKGNQHAAMKYTRYGQVLLADLRRRMTFQNLIQDRSRITLIDGTEIVCQSIFGQDQVTITTIPKCPKKKKEPFIPGLLGDSYILLYQTSTTLYQILFNPAKLLSTLITYVDIEDVDHTYDRNSNVYTEYPCPTFGTYIYDSSDFYNHYSLWTHLAVGSGYSPPSHLPVNMYSCVDKTTKKIWHYTKYIYSTVYPYPMMRPTKDPLWDNINHGPWYVEQLYIHTDGSFVSTPPKFVQLSGDLDLTGWITAADMHMGDMESFATPYMYSVTRAEAPYPEGYRIRQAFLQPSVYHPVNWSYFNYIFYDWILKDDGSNQTIERSRYGSYSDWATRVSSAFGADTANMAVDISSESWSQAYETELQNIAEHAFTDNGGIFTVPQRCSRSVLDIDGVWKDCLMQFTVNYNIANLGLGGIYSNYTWVGVSNFFTLPTGAYASCLGESTATVVGGDSTWDMHGTLIDSTIYSPYGIKGNRWNDIDTLLPMPGHIKSVFTLSGTVAGGAPVIYELTEVKGLILRGFSSYENPYTASIDYRSISYAVGKNTAFLSLRHLPEPTSVRFMLKSYIPSVYPMPTTDEDIPVIGVPSEDMSLADMLKSGIWTDISKVIKSSITALTGSPYNDLYYLGAFLFQSGDLNEPL